MALFSFFKSDPLRARRETAEALLQQGRKVWVYRRDVLAPDVAERLQQARAGLAALLAAPGARGNSGGSGTAGDGGAGESPAAIAERFDVASEEMHAVLTEAGGKIYPLRLLPEWIELIVTAAIVACGVRAFFLQPFKIPTNSMYPTYHGMTAEVYPLDADGPGGLHRAWRKLALWTERVEARTEGGGEVIIPLGQFGDASQRPQDRYASGILGTQLFRSPLDVYEVRVGRERVEVPVPREFDFRRVVLRTYFPKIAARADLHENDRWRLVLEQHSDPVLNALRTGVRAPAGGRVVNFDVLTGDLVLVDRVSYNFVRPKAGDPFVFSVKKIPRLAQEQYYIKRLAGVPGDTLQVREPKLLRNGTSAGHEPGTKPAFTKNADRRTDLEYYGYRVGEGRADSYPLAEPHTVSPRHYFAMGDNSAGSYDSRGWGEVPEREVVGRAFFILYPFAKRWGLAE